MLYGAGRPQPGRCRARQPGHVGLRNDLYRRESANLLDPPASDTSSPYPEPPPLRDPTCYTAQSQRPHAHQADEYRSRLATGGCSASSIGVHDRCEVIANRLPIWEVNKYAAADRQEGIEAHLRDCLRIMVAIPTGILLNERLNGRGHETTLAAAETYGQWEPQRTTNTQHGRDTADALERVTRIELA
jgi:hypothetical protein